LSFVEILGTSRLLMGMIINCRPINPSVSLASSPLLRVNAATPKVSEIKRIVIPTRRLSTLSEETLETMDRTGPYTRLAISANRNEPTRKIASVKPSVDEPIRK